MSNLTLLWVDLETTGVDLEHDDILEVGCILADTNLDVLTDGERSWVVDVGPSTIWKVLRNPPVRRMHTDNGLLDDLLDSPDRCPLRHIDVQVCAWLDKAAPDADVALAGSGVSHFDRRFIEDRLPGLWSRVKHWQIDVGVIRRAYEMFTGQPSPSDAETRKTHRALDDARCHLDEARAFARLWNENR